MKLTARRHAPNRPCFLVTRRDRFQELTIQAHRADLYTLYESLARLDCDSRHPYHTVVEQAHQRFPQANLIVTFRLDTDTTLPRLSPHVTRIDLEMDVKSFRSAEPPRSENGWRQEGNRLIYRVCADQKLENLFQ